MEELPIIFYSDEILYMLLPEIDAYRIITASNENNKLRII